MGELERMEKQAQEIEADLLLCYAGGAPDFAIQEGEQDLEEAQQAIAAIKAGVYEAGQDDGGN